jgi:hypothetical protein
MPVTRRPPATCPARRLLLAALAVGVCLVATTAVARAVSMPVEAGVYDPPKVRPAIIDLSGDGATLVAGYTHAHPTMDSGGFGRLDWTQWGSRQALARGAVWADSCQPNCATGVYRARHASVRVSNPRAGVFQDMSITVGDATELYKAEHRQGGWLWSTLS